MVEGDPDRLRQVLDNLARNAVSHTPIGTAIGITVAAETTPDGANGRAGDPAWAVVIVHDDGPGIDPDDAPRIFEAFYRSDPSRSRTSGGAGLGLAIVAAIVEAHGGTVALLPGPGATFEVRLPTRRPRSDPDPDRAPVRASSSGSGPS